MHLVALKSTKGLCVWLELVYLELLVWKLHDINTEVAFKLPLRIQSKQWLQWTLQENCGVHSITQLFRKTSFFVLSAIDSPGVVLNTLQLTTQVPSERDTRNTCIFKDAWQTSVLTGTFPQAVSIWQDSCENQWQMRCRIHPAYSWCCGHPAQVVGAEPGVPLWSRTSCLASVWMTTGY